MFPGAASVSINGAQKWIKGKEDGERADEGLGLEEESNLGFLKLQGRAHDQRNCVSGTSEQNMRPSVSTFPCRQ